MRREERINKICEECGQREVCGYYLHGPEDRCVFLINVMTGWNYGQYDTLKAVEDYIDRGNSTWIEEFMDGLRQSIDNGKED